MPNDRLRALVVVGLAVPLLAFHVALKKQLKPEDVTRLADLAGRPAAWQGRVAAEFELKTLAGQTFHLSEHIGKEVVVLNFFATWCGPCREEMPELTRFVERHQGRPLRLLAIDVEEKPELVQKFVSDTALKLDVALDESGSVAQSYGVHSYPTAPDALLTADDMSGPSARSAKARCD